MTGAKQIMQAQAVNNHNIANISTIGFRADSVTFDSEPIYGPGYATRVNAVAGDAGTDFSAGTMENTGRDLDIAVNGNGFIAVRGTDGQEAYTRAGDLRVSPTGAVTTASGLPVLTESGPLVVPPSTTVNIGSDGTVSVVPQGSAPFAVSQVDRIKLVNPPTATLQKGDDGLLRLKERRQGEDRRYRVRDVRNAGVEQCERRAVAHQHDRTAASVRISNQEHQLNRHR